MNRVILVSSAAAGLSLIVLYALFLDLFVGHLGRPAVDLVESVVIITQIARLAGVIAYYGTKPARLEVLLVLFSLETFLVMFLILAYLVDPATAYSNLAHSVFSTWIAALFTILPAYLIFAGTVQMTRSRSLISVVPSFALEFGLLTFASSALLSFTGTFNFGNFFDFLVSSAKGDLTSGAVPDLSALAIVLPSITMYCALLVYTTASTAEVAVPPRVTFVLPFLGAALALAWIFSGAYLVRNTLLTFTVPGMIVVAVLWAYMRR
jgi:hypothetical protein